MKENVFVRIWNKIKKFCKDTTSELKKVPWTSKTELFKSTKLVVVTVLTDCKRVQMALRGVQSNQVR